MKQIERKGTVKGSVLFTVVTVMLVMVTFLMTTLVLTASSKRRAHYSYFETQAQYAAQAALNSITARAYTDPAFHTYLMDEIRTGVAPQNMTVHFPGSEIQFTDTDPTTGAGIVECTVERVADQCIWDDVTHAIHSQPAWKITAVGRVGHGRNTSEYTVCKTVYEKFQANPDLAGTTAENSVVGETYNYTSSGSPGPGPAPVSLSTSPGLLSLSNQGVGNNGIWLGPQYSNLQTLPLGRTYYDTAGDDYWLRPENDNYGAGNLIYVNNLSVKVMDSIMFQHKREGAAIYGNVEVKEARRSQKGLHFKAGIEDGDKPTQSYECNYVYIDGVLNVQPEAACYVGTYHGANNGSHPVNLFCGAVDCSCDLSVYGDSVLYDPALESKWSGTSENTALIQFTNNNISKNSGAGYADDVTGNLVCNNRKLTLKDMTINGDLIYANPDGALSLDNVTIAGDLISSVAPTGSYTAANTFTGNDAYGKINTAYYPQTAEDLPENERETRQTYKARVDAISTDTTTSGRSKYDYSLMPYLLRIDEVFQNYYRWDLQCTSEADCWKYINNGSGDTPDPLIDESEAAGHNWAPVAFDTGSVTIGTDGSGNRTYTAASKTWVPGTQNTAGLYSIPKHTFYNKDKAIIDLTGSSAMDISTLAEFQAAAGGATAVPNKSASDLILKNKVTVCGHNQGTTVVTKDMTQKTYVVKQSCTLDLSTFSGWGGDNSMLFIDPSASTDPLYIVLKGAVSGGNLGQNGFFIMVNNTAYYTGNNYENPSAYASQTTPVFPANKQVYIFLDSDFTVQNKFYMMVTGTYAQLMANDLNIVQKPVFPNDPNFSTVDAKIRYAYEMVPNFTVFGCAQDYNFGSNSCGFLNADIVMPKSKFNFRSLNMGNQKVTYREDANSIAWESGKNDTAYGSVDGNSYLCGIGAFMVNGFDADTDKKGMFAYIGGTATSSPPTIIRDDRNTTSSSSPLGEVHVPFIEDHHESPS